MSTETPEYAQFCRRIIRAYARRVADESEVDLAEMVAVRDEMDAAIAEAVNGMRERHGYSWAYIAAGLGTTRQNAQQRFGRVKARTKALAPASGSVQARQASTA